MYVGPWQELRALERAKAAEDVRIRQSVEVAEELERLRRAIDVVSNELDPAAALKVREALANEMPKREVPTLDTARSEKSLTSIVSRPRRRSQSEASSSRASTPPPKSSRSAPASYDSRATVRMLRAQREARFKTKFWPWGKPVKRDEPTTRVQRMKVVYLKGASAQAQKTPQKQRRPEVTARIAPKPVDHFELTDDQIGVVAKYFGDTSLFEKPETASHRAASPPQTPACPSTRDAVDDLLSWAQKLGEWPSVDHTKAIASTAVDAPVVSPAIRA